MRNKVLISVIALLIIGGVYAVLGKQEGSEQKDESEAMMDDKDNVMMKGENETEKGEEMPASSADKMKDDKAFRIGGGKIFPDHRSHCHCNSYESPRPCQFLIR